MPLPRGLGCAWATARPKAVSDVYKMTEALLGQLSTKHTACNDHFLEKAEKGEDGG